MHDIRDVMAPWPTIGVAAVLVPSHGDFAGGSILKEEEFFLAADFEYSGLNFAGIDVSYLFFQGLYGQGFSEPVRSGGEPKWKSYPSLRQREEFAKAYLEGSGHAGEEAPQNFLFDVEKFSPAVGLWAGMSLARNPATRRAATWYLSWYSSACKVLKAAETSPTVRHRILRDGVWATACAADY
jgi:thiamine kinase-like enzyme